MSLTQVQGGMILPSTTLTTPIVATTLGVGGATPSTSGAGITFPATQSASSDANTLDDYEEGTWTPTVVQGFTSPTYSNQFGRYTKVGRICYFQVLLGVSGGTRNGSQIKIDLPFTSNSNGSFAGGAYWAYVGSGVVGSTSTNVPLIYIGSNNPNCEFYQTDGNSFTGNNLSNATPSMYFVGWMECA
jgi:hypothetical protein